MKATILQSGLLTAFCDCDRLRSFRRTRSSRITNRSILACFIGLVGVGLIGVGLAGAEEPTRRPNASHQPAVQKALAYLDTNRDGVLCGQNIGHSNYGVQEGYRDYVVELARQSGKWPALLGVDYGFDEIKSIPQTNALLREYAHLGGWVTISMHPPNPWTGSHVHDTRVGQMAELLKPGSAVNKRWRRELDYVAGGLAELRDAKTVVLWRPFHEMNGGWFWWCPKSQGQWLAPEDYIALWRDMFRYFTDVKGLDNLLWVYSAAVQTDKNQPSATHYYPGDHYVDIVGLDWYLDQDLNELDRFGSYSQLVGLNKPFGLTEFGPAEQRDGRFDNRLLLKVIRRYPATRFCLAWHSWPENKVALIDQQHARELLVDPAMIDRDELPPHGKWAR